MDGWMDGGMDGWMFGVAMYRIQIPELEVGHFSKTLSCHKISPVSVQPSRDPPILGGIPHQLFGLFSSFLAAEAQSPPTRKALPPLLLNHSELSSHYCHTNELCAFLSQFFAAWRDAA